MPDLSIAIVGFYAGLCGLILLWLTAATVKLRGKYKISLGDGGNAHMQRIMRGHSNAIENMAVILILLLIMAALGAPGYILHGFGIAIVVSRAMHAHHFIQEDAVRWTRFYSSVATVFILLFASVGLIGHSLLTLLG